MMSAVRAPKSKPGTMAFWILSASINAMRSTASVDGCPFLNVPPERKRVATFAVEWF
jgi:hypothetical protein